MTAALRETVQVGIRISARAHGALAKRASEVGVSPSGYAKMLFEAAFAARIGQERNDPPADAELDEQVRLVFALAGQGSTAAIARATGIPEPRVVRILDAWRQAPASLPKEASSPVFPAEPRGEDRSIPPAPAEGSGYPTALIRKLWAQGLSVKEIASRIGKSPRTFEMWAGKHRDICPKRRNP